MTTFVLIHSPLTGPSAWQRVAAYLEVAGQRAVVPSLSEVIAGDGHYYPALHAAVADAIHASGTESVTLVAHSGAGALLPGIAHAIEHLTHLDGAVFVDAALPYPAQSWFDSVPRELAAQLRGLAV